MSTETRFVNVLWRVSDRWLEAYRRDDKAAMQRCDVRYCAILHLRNKMVGTVTHS